MTAVHRQFVTTGMVTALLALTGLASAAFGPKGSTLGAGVATGGPTAGPGNPTAPPQVPSGLDSAKANGGSITLGDESGSGKTTWALVPPTHTVRKGDTLWEICDQYFNNPWQWPRVWSYNPDILNPPSTDHGTLPNLRFSFSDSHVRQESGGWTRQITERELGISKNIAGVNMRLNAGGVRELHWHKEAEWAYMLYGSARITACTPIEPFAPPMFST